MFVHFFNTSSYICFLVEMENDGEDELDIAVYMQLRWNMDAF